MAVLFAVVVVPFVLVPRGFLQLRRLFVIELCGFGEAGWLLVFEFVAIIADRLGSAGVASSRIAARATAAPAAPASPPFALCRLSGIEFGLVVFGDGFLEEFGISGRFFHRGLP